MKQLLKMASSLFSQLYFLCNLRTHEAVSENTSLLLTHDPFYHLLMVVRLIIVQFNEGGLRFSSCRRSKVGDAILSEEWLLMHNSHDCMIQLRKSISTF